MQTERTGNSIQNDAFKILQLSRSQNPFE